LRKYYDFQTKKAKVNMSKLMNYLDSNLAATENKTLKILNTELCYFIDKANAVIKARDTRKNNGDKETDTPPVV
jgi:hypothetical protein